MRVIEIPSNPNCPPVEMRVFHDLEPPRAVSQVQTACQSDEPAWYDVTGWTAGGTSCPALMQKVDDSGEGTAWLVFGGDAGLRFKPAGHPGPWGLEDPAQWGAPFLLLVDLHDVSCDG